MRYNPCHVLHQLLPSVKTTSYNLRARSHNFTLPASYLTNLGSKNSEWEWVRKAASASEWDFFSHSHLVRKFLKILCIYIVSRFWLVSLFSMYGLIKYTRRSSLAPYRLNKLTFVHDNYHLFCQLGSNELVAMQKRVTIFGSAWCQFNSDSMVLICSVLHITWWMVHGAIWHWHYDPWLFVQCLVT